MAAQMRPDNGNSAQAKAERINEKKVEVEA